MGILIFVEANKSLHSSQFAMCVCSLRPSFTLNPFYWFNISQKKTETALNTSAGSKGVGRERDIHPPTHLSSKRVAAGRLTDSGTSE